MPDPSTLVLVAAAVAGTFVWRAVGVLAAGRVVEGSPLFDWVSCVAYAIAAGLMMKLLVMPSGALADTALAHRLLALAAALVVFFAAGRRLVPALAAGVGMFLAQLIL
jgi:branched-subunit amino acid transport protein